MWRIIMTRIKDLIYMAKELQRCRQQLVYSCRSKQQHKFKARLPFSISKHTPQHLSSFSFSTPTFFFLSSFTPLSRTHYYFLVTLNILFYMFTVTFDLFLCHSCRSSKTLVVPSKLLALCFFCIEEVERKRA